VSPVAIGRVAGLFALAVVSRFGLFGFKNDRRKIGAFMFAIAERLVLRKPTRAVCVFLAGFDFDLFWETSCDFWFVHVGIHPNLVVAAGSTIASRQIERSKHNCCDSMPTVARLASERISCQKQSFSRCCVPSRRIFDGPVH